MIKNVEQAIKPHDKYQIEVKLDYQLSEGGVTRYQVSTYIFIPQNLGVDKNSYPKSDFYRDIQNYIRLKTPTFILRDFTEHVNSPLVVIERIVAEPGWSQERRYKERLIRSFKLLSAMLKSSIREHFNLIEKRVEQAPPDSKVHLLIYNLVEEYLMETSGIANKYRSFYSAFNLPNVDEDVFAAYQFTDESISLLIEESSIEMFQVVDEFLKKSNRSDFQEKLSEQVAAETKHRKAHGYASVLKEGEENEEYAFRASVLKKYASSVLHLSTAIRREGVELEHFFFALAAGFSMIFATVVAFYFQRRFGSFTFPVFIALVIGYMFKDRIKELGRGLFSRYLQNMLYDRRIMIRTLDGKHKLGIMREKVHFIREKDAPPDVIAARSKDRFTDLDNSGQGERIIHYSKNIVLFTDVFKEVFVDMPEITGLNDIMRYDVRAYLRKMAEPVQKRHYLEDGELITFRSHKVYHVNMIYEYDSFHSDEQKLYHRIRLVLNRAGIKRLEQLEL